MPSDSSDLAGESLVCLAPRWHGRPSLPRSFLVRLIPNWQRREAFFVANLARDWGFSWFPCGLATAATLQTLHFPAGKCLTAIPHLCRSRAFLLDTSSAGEAFAKDDGWRQGGEV